MKELLSYRGPKLHSGRTAHSVSGHPAPEFDELKIVRFDDAEFNILYFCGGREITDTAFASIEDCLDQAAFEFGISASEWQPPT